MKEIIAGQNGYDIPCINNLVADTKIAVIISHGFGSSKESQTAQTITKTLGKYGIGTFSYDFPAHGDSPVDGDMLRIGNCTSDLAAVEAHVRKIMPNVEIAYFSSSFGAYINLIYLATCKHAGRKSFLRCAALDMRGIFRRDITPEHYALLNNQGFVMLDKGYVRLKITREFLDDLNNYDVFKLYHPGMTKIAMIHGTADITAPIDNARHFATQFGIELTEVAGADHRFLIPGGMDKVVDAAVNFFK